MFNRHERHRDTGERSDLACPQPGGVHHVLGANGAFRGDHVPLATVELIRFDDRCESVHFGAVITCGFCKGMRHAGGVAVARIRFEEHGLQAVGIQDRCHLHGFGRGDELGHDAVSPSLGANHPVGFEFLVCQGQP